MAYGNKIVSFNVELVKKMGRRGPRLIIFLEKGLLTDKYRNLKYEDISKSIFSIYFPHKTKLLSLADEQIFKDWYTLNKKEYVSKKDYTDARQAMSSSLRKSDYVEKVLVNGNKLVYRILKEEEVVEKKKKKDELKKMKKEESDYGSDLSSVDSPKSSGVDSPSSSGVGSPSSSGVDSPGSSGIDSTIGDDLDIESSSKLIQDISHNHGFGFPYQTKSVLKGNLLSDKFIPMPVSDPMDFVEEPMYVDNTVDVNLSEPQNSIIRNGSVTLDTVDYTRTGDNIPTQEILSQQDFQNFEDISYGNLITRNFLPNDGSLPSFDDHPSDFNFELFGSDLDKLLPPHTNMEMPPQTSMEMPPQTSMEMPPQTSMEMPPQTSMELPPQTSMELPPQTSMELPPQTSMELPPQTSMELPPQTSMELPPQTSMELPPQTSMELPPQTSMELPPQTSMELPPQTSMELPPQTSMELPPLTNPDLHRLISDVPSSDKTVAGKRIFQCTKFGYLRKLLVLFCEAQISEVHSANAGEMQIIFDDTVYKEIQGHNLLDCMFFGDDMLAIFQPRNE
ncbi:uncharacterized protein TNCT_7371 [Trichonephila clavata]|uniref:Uncharacterized protein n=1 Tax=Trichonephila clavata TaxID=2740835 RepID=A0A8X6LGJ3_TRICU|nr:uncharacterized protein TNCT_7371 [Trichonephila clavata]